MEKKTCCQYMQGFTTCHVKCYDQVLKTKWKRSCSENIFTGKRDGFIADRESTEKGWITLYARCFKSPTYIEGVLCHQFSICQSHPEYRSHFWSQSKVRQWLAHLKLVLKANFPCSSLEVTVICTVCLNKLSWVKTKNKCTWSNLKIRIFS